MSIPYQKLPSLSNNFHIVKQNVEVKPLEDRKKPLTLEIGTLVHVQKTIGTHEVAIRVVNDKKKYPISEEDTWRCLKQKLIHVDSMIWPFIQAVDSPFEKVALLSNKKLCKDIVTLKKGDSVNIFSPENEEIYLAIVRYIGPIPRKGPGTYFGVELLDVCKGNTDGTYEGLSYFQCPMNTGLFVSVNQMKPTEKSVHQLRQRFEKPNKFGKTTAKFYCDEPEEKRNGEKPNLKDRLIGFPEKDKKSGLKNFVSLDRKGLSIQLTGNDSYFHHDYNRTTEKDGSPVDENLILWDETKENNLNKAKQQELNFKTSPFSEIEEKYAKENLKCLEDCRCLEDQYGGSIGSEGNGYYDIPEFPDQEIVEGSAVEVMYHNEPHYGVVRWIGTLRNDSKGTLKAGIEMDEESPDFGDGTYKYHKYFSCNPQRSLFVDLHLCRLDSRVIETIPPLSRKSEDFGAVESPVVPGAVSPVSREGDITPICGKYKGIQGHHNSCYLDATLFSMFTFTSVFDSLLYRPAGKGDIPHYDKVQKVLREEIVNPLRKNNFVRADRVMKLRRLMEELSSVSGLTTEEKDPEEFLTSLVAQILKAEPFLKLSSGQEAYHYQLFVEKNEKLVLPTVQQLFEQSFFSSDIKLKEVPACLIIQMPRFGKSFKMYPRILPSTLLDVTDVIEDSPRQCSVCGSLATYECRSCFDEGHGSEIGLQNTAFCNMCLKKVHSHTKRTSHTYRPISIPNEFFDVVDDKYTIPRLYMQLFAVVCIETSHYVAFVKCGMGSDAPWCFFDSMADRKGEQNGYNIPEVVPCPDLPQWLSEKGVQTLQQFKDDRQLPEHAKRLLCDAYMCMYQSTEVMMYR